MGPPLEGLALGGAGLPRRLPPQSTRRGRPTSMGIAWKAWRVFQTALVIMLVLSKSRHFDRDAYTAQAPTMYTATTFALPDMNDARGRGWGAGRLPPAIRRVRRKEPSSSGRCHACQRPAFPDTAAGDLLNRTRAGRAAAHAVYGA
ncbi:unnamed protein product [Amoebophrya sp. A120]|nr:unnamed protein product [Amoebophrya sp. A120]|eukprot:GSA120T00005723001.1